MPLPTGALQWPTGVRHCHAARESLGGRQCDGAHMMRIALRKNLYDHAPFIRLENRVDGGQQLLKSDVHNAAAHRHNLP